MRAHRARAAAPECRAVAAALRAVDPDAVLIRGRTLEEVLAVHPAARDYFRCHPLERVRSFWADKHTLDAEHLPAVAAETPKTIEECRNLPRLNDAGIADRRNFGA